MRAPTSNIRPLAAGRTAPGFTMLELLFVSVIGVLVTGMIVWLLVVSAREQRLAFVECQVYNRADLLQDKIMAILRQASRENVVPFAAADAVSPSSDLFYYRIIFRDMINGPNKELRFDPKEGTIVYDPDRAVSGNEETIDKPSPLTHLERVWFGMGLKAGGLADASLIMVQLEVSDRGVARGSYRGDEEDHSHWITSVRTFAVHLRQN